MKSKHVRFPTCLWCFKNIRHFVVFVLEKIFDENIIREILNYFPVGDKRLIFVE
jgi:hypothetical protein